MIDEENVPMERPTILDLSKERRGSERRTNFKRHNLSAPKFSKGSKDLLIIHPGLEELVSLYGKDCRGL